MKTCKCPPNSAFHWKENAAEISFAELQQTANSAETSRKVVERSRANGIEPMVISQLSPGKRLAITLAPKNFTIYSKAGAPKLGPQKAHCPDCGQPLHPNRSC